MYSPFPYSFINLQPKKALCPTYLTLSGSTICDNFLQLEKALYPTSFIPSGIFTLNRFSQPENKPDEILDNDIGNFAVDKLTQLEKA